MEHGPIFIGGLDHSGKTPLRRMLSAHPDLLLTRRTYMWSRFYQKFGDLSDSENLEQCLSTMLAYKSIQELRSDRNQIRAEFAQGPKTYERLFAIIQQQNAQRAGKRRWGDQLGLVERFADVIFSAYPDAKMIHMIRDPRQRYYEENGKQQHRGKTGWLTARWLFSARLAERNSQRYPERYLVVRYEDLMQDTKNTLSRVCDFLNEDLCAEMLAVPILGDDFDEHEEQESTKRSRKTAKEPKTEIAFTQLAAQRVLNKHGYTIDQVKLSAGERLKFALIEIPANLAGMAAWNVIEGRQFRRLGEVKE